MPQHCTLFPKGLKPSSFIRNLDRVHIDSINVLLMELFENKRYTTYNKWVSHRTKTESLILLRFWGNSVKIVI